MALTESSMVNLGVKAPDFLLLDAISEKKLSLNELAGQKATVIMFICNHCPYVLHVNSELIKLCTDFKPKGVSFVAISANNAEAYPQDGFAEMKIHAAKVGYNFPYLYDETQEIAKAYEAECTPDFFVYDANLKLVYRGRLDESRPRVENPIPPNGKDIRGVLNAIIANQKVSEIQFPSMGCNIKWKN